MSILLRTEQPFWGILSHWDGTCLVLTSLLIKDPLLWITIAIYIGMRVSARKGILDYVSEFSTDSNIIVIGSFVSFSLVFYVPIKTTPDTFSSMVRAVRV